MREKRLKQLMALLFCEMMIFLPFIMAFDISNLQVETFQGAADVSWSTNVPANYSFSYQVSGSSPLDARFLYDSVYRNDQGVSVSGLEPGERYSFRIFSEDQSGGAEDLQGVFRVPDDSIPPQPTLPNATSVTLEAVVLEWKTSSTIIPDFSRFVIYRNGEEIERTTKQTISDTNISGLETYFYQVAILDTSGNIGPLSEAAVVTTPQPDLSAPKLSKVKMGQLSSASVILIWETDEEASSIVYYTSDGVTNERSQNGKYVNHSMTLYGLSLENPYVFVVSSCDPYDNCVNSSAIDYVPGSDITPPTLDLDIPSLLSSNRLIVNGTTEALARVFFYVDGSSAPQRGVQADFDGFFETDVIFDLGRLNNSLRIVASDPSGNEIEEFFELEIDTTKPLVSVEELPNIVTSPSIKFVGNVSEAVTLDIFLDSEESESVPAPAEVYDLRATSVSASSINLGWKSNTSEGRPDFFTIYRNGAEVGRTRSTSFTDCVSAQTEYTYSIIATSNECKSSPSSDTLAVITPTGAGCSEPRDREEIMCKTTEPIITKELNGGSFQQTISLDEGWNTLQYHFYDDAGNTVVLTDQIIYDVAPPRVEETNIRDLNPSYTTDVTIRGKISEASTVKVIVNNASEYITLTDEFGNFSVDVELERLDYYATFSQTDDRGNLITGNAVDTPTQTQQDIAEFGGSYDAENYFSYQTGNEDFRYVELSAAASAGIFRNRIDVIAIDNVGRESPAVTDDIDYQSCGSGNAWLIELNKDEIQPNLLLPRQLLTGSARITFPYKITWVGGSGFFNDEEIPRISPRLYFREINNEDKDNWDVDWFRNQVRIIPKPDTNNTEGFVVITAKPLNSQFGQSNSYRNELAQAYREDDLENFTTTVDMETNISENRLGDCIVPGFGCVRLPLQMEIRYNDPFLTGEQDDVYSDYIATPETSRSSAVVQRQCWNVEIGIDRRIDPNIIPEDFLKTAIRFLNETIEMIDVVLEPLTIIKEYTLYACLSSWVLLYIKAAQRRWNCEMSGTIKSFGGSGFNPLIAEQGLCTYVYGTEDQAAASSNTFGEEGDKSQADALKSCEKCEDSIASYEEFTRLVYSVCDRLGCPSAPTFTTYIRSVAGKTSKETTIGLKTSSENSDVKAIKLEERSDCTNVDYTSVRAIEEQVALWSAYKKDKDFAKEYTGIDFDKNLKQEDGEIMIKNPVGGGDVFAGSNEELYKSCLEPHMPNSNCCVFEYMSEFDSACGLGQKGMLFDEAIESYCYVANNNYLFTENIDPNFDESPKLYQEYCKSTIKSGYNALASVCEKNPSDQINLVDSGVPYKVSTNYVYAPAQDDLSIDEKTALQREKESNVNARKEEGKLEVRSISQDQFEGQTATTFGGISNGCPDGIRGNLDQQNVFYRVLPDDDGDGYVIHRGMILRNLDVNVDRTSSLDPNSDSLVGSSMVFRPIQEIEENWFKTPEENDGGKKQFYKEEIYNQNGYKEFREDLLKCALTTTQVDKGTRVSTPTPEGGFVSKIQYTDAVLSESAIENAYIKVRNAIGVKDKEEIVDPTSSFLRSVQCLCLPGITSYLKLWRAMMVAVKACLQTILLTGDGNPGVCQSVLTRYVCDLIYDLIRCFTNKYSTGISRGFDVSNAPGNILGTLTSAGRDVQDTVSSRYGNSGFYRALFSERQLVHAICLWFFTGTFDLDFRDLMEGEFGDVPVDSQGLIASCQRRFISYNSADQGKTIWNYYFGLGLIAGADLYYEVSLVCSEGYECNYGYGREKCDCHESGEKRRRISIPGAPNSLSQYDVLEETVDQTFQSDVRYDKVELVYRYVDKDQDRESGNVSCNLRTVGGDPPGYCQFDPAQGIYRCGFSIGQEDYAMISSVLPINSEFAVGQSVSALVQVTQKVPETLECQSAQTCSSTKYLAVEIFDPTKNIHLMRYEDDGNAIPILLDGSFVYQVPQNGFQIGESQLSKLVEGSQFGCVLKDGAQNQFAASCSGNLPNLNDEIEIKYTVPTGNLLEEFDPENANSEDVLVDVGYFQYRLNGEGNFKDFEEGCSFSRSNQLASSCRLNFGDSNTIIIQFVNFNKNNERQVIVHGSTITLTTQHKNQKDSPQQGGNICGPNKEYVIWKGKVALFDSTGGGYDGALYFKSDNIYSYNNIKQEKTFDIKIKCRSESSVTQENKILGDEIIYTKKQDTQPFGFTVETTEDITTANYYIVDSSGTVQAGSYSLKRQNLGNNRIWVTDTVNTWIYNGNNAGNLKVRVVVTRSNGDSDSEDYPLT